MKASNSCKAVCIYVKTCAGITEVWSDDKTIQKTNKTTDILIEALLLYLTCIKQEVRIPLSLKEPSKAQS